MLTGERKITEAEFAWRCFLVPKTNKRRDQLPWRLSGRRLGENPADRREGLPSSGGRGLRGGASAFGIIQFG